MSIPKTKENQWNKKKNSKRGRGTKQFQARKKLINKKAMVNPSLSVITLIVNRLNSPTEEINTE